MRGCVPPSMTSSDNEDIAPLLRERNKALRGVVIGVLAGFALGVPTSFIKRRSSLPWEPSHMLVAGTIWAVVITIFTVLIAFMLHRYVSLYRSGARVTGMVTSERVTPAGRGVVVHFQHSSGEPRFSWVFPSQLPVGQPTAVIVGPPATKLVLPHNGERFVRGSALTQAEVAQLAAQVG